MKKLLFILLVSISMNAKSQEEAINNIRKHYKKIGDQIKECKKENNKGLCSLYNNINLTNSGNQQWRSSGNYKKEVQFWYNDSPWNCDECGEDGINVLKKVVSSEQAGLTITYKEWLFKGGKLIFYFVKILGENQTEEYRYYYQNDILIKHIEGGNAMNGEEAAKRFKEVILQKAKNLQKEFLLGFK